MFISTITTKEGERMPLGWIARGTIKKFAKMEENQFIQFTPLIPDTSFRMTTGSGMLWKSAVLFEYLPKEIPKHLDESDRSFCE